MPGSPAGSGKDSITAADGSAGCEGCDTDSGLAVATTVTAIGARPQGDTPEQGGGPGARVTATLSGLVPGSTLYLEVGGEDGWNGGGAGGSPAPAGSGGRESKRSGVSFMAAGGAGPPGLRLQL